MVPGQRVVVVALKLRSAGSKPVSPPSEGVHHARLRGQEPAETNFQSHPSHPQASALRDQGGACVLLKESSVTSNFFDGSLSESHISAQYTTRHDMCICNY